MVELHLCCPGCKSDANGVVEKRRDGSIIFTGITRYIWSGSAEMLAEFMITRFNFMHSDIANSNMPMTVMTSFEGCHDATARTVRPALTMALKHLMCLQEKQLTEECTGSYQEAGALAPTWNPPLMVKLQVRKSEKWLTLGSVEKASDGSIIVTSSLPNPRYVWSSGTAEMLAKFVLTRFNFMHPQYANNDTPVSVMTSFEGYHDATSRTVLPALTMALKHLMCLQLESDANEV